MEADDFDAAVLAADERMSDQGRIFEGSWRRPLPVARVTSTSGFEATDALESKPGG